MEFLKSSYNTIKLSPFEYQRGSQDSQIANRRECNGYVKVKVDAGCIIIELINMELK